MMTISPGEEMHELFLLMKTHNEKVAVQLAILERRSCTIAEALVAVAELRKLYTPTTLIAH